MKRVGWKFAIVAGFTATGIAILADQVGEPKATGVLVPTGERVRGIGNLATLPQRIVDLIPAGDGRVWVKNTGGVSLVEPAAGKVLSTLAVPGGVSYSGLALSADGQTLVVSNAGSDLQIGSTTGGLKWTSKVTLPTPEAKGSAYPCALEFAPDGTLYAAASRSNTLVQVDVKGAKVLRNIDVGVAPTALALSPDGKLALVGCWSSRAKTGDRTADASGTRVPVTLGGRAAGGELTIVDLAAGTVAARLPIGLQPSDIVFTGPSEAYIACANSDTLVKVTRGAALAPMVTTYPIQLSKPDVFGYGPNDLAYDAASKRLYVALGGLNGVARYRLSAAGAPVLEGIAPTDWWPAAVALQDGQLIVGTAKGTGSRRDPMPATGRNVYQFTGTIRTLSPDRCDRGGVQEVLRRAELRQAGDAFRPGRKGVKPVPVPARVGEPSSIAHVVYILKENRTYDNVFGDRKDGDGDPRFCVFPEKVTPNHHAIASEFVLLDNYYCNGVLSADGHAWSTEAIATPYFERSFGGWTRSYPFGDDPLAVSQRGYLWEDVVKAGRSFRNFGEFDYAEVSPRSSFKQIWDDYRSGAGKITFPQVINLEYLRRFTSHEVPGWNMLIPDQIRADGFLKEFREFERKGNFPNFTFIYLPQDHGSGTSPGMPTPRAHMADNDLAVGRILEALTMSRFWAKTAVFVVEDDPQAGFDHVDGHRSVCLVASPYTRLKKTVSRFYNQTSVVGTMRRMLGVPPLTLYDARSPLMTELFTGRADLTPYRCRPAQIPLDELNPSASNLSGQAKENALLSASLDFSKPDRIKDDTLNRILWHATFPTKPYPVAYAGAHARGLAAKGLRLDKGVQEDED